jgi:hypothetical protein
MGTWRQVADEAEGLATAQMPNLASEEPRGAMKCVEHTIPLG